VNNNDSDINTLSWQRTREVFSVPKNSDLAEPFTEGSTMTQLPTLIEKHGEVFMSTWIAQDCCAFFSLRTSVLGDQRSAAFEVQIMSDGRVETYRLQPNEDSLVDEGFMQSFLDRISSELHPTDETDGVDVGSITDIEQGLIDVPQV